jgi:hypothetical protein
MTAKLSTLQISTMLILTCEAEPFAQTMADIGSLMVAKMRYFSSTA